MTSATDSPLFVVGCPRSGTTLLASLLRPTPWGIPFETHFILKYLHRLPRFGDLNESRAFRRLMAAIFSQRAVMQWKLDLNLDRLYDSLERRDFATISDAICRAHAQRMGWTSWGDKTPHYVFGIRQLHELFPHSRFIYIVRDGRDVAMSLMELDWGPANIVASARLWKQCNEVQDDISRMKQMGLLYQLRYEDLLSSPREQLEAMYSFLGCDPACTITPDLVQPIKKSNHGKWKSKLSTSDVRLFESVAAGTLARLGYETTYVEQPVPLLKNLKYEMHDRIKHWSHLIKINTLDTIRIRYFNQEPFGE